MLIELANIMVKIEQHISGKFFYTIVITILCIEMLWDVGLAMPQKVITAAK